MFEWLARLEEAQENLREVLECSAEGLNVAEAALLARQAKKAHEILSRVTLDLEMFEHRGRVRE